MDDHGQLVKLKGGTEPIVRVEGGCVMCEGECHCGVHATALAFRETWNTSDVSDI